MKNLFQHIDIALRAVYSIHDEDGTEIDATYYWFSPIKGIDTDVFAVKTR